MELFRCILFLAVDVILSVQNLDTGGKLKNFFQLLGFLFCFVLFCRFCFFHPCLYFKRVHLEISLEETVNQSIFVSHFLTDVQNREEPATTNP